MLGASSDPQKLGYRPLDYLRRHGFQGTVYPVNPRAEAILGWPCLADLKDLPDGVDTVLVSLPAPLVPEALEECARKGARLAVVLTAGVDPDLKAPAGLHVLGPNSMGFLNAHRALAPSWSSSLDLPAVGAGEVALISQSGGLGGSVLNRLHDKGIGFSYAFWTGNETFVDTCHLVRFLLEDPTTRVIALLVEGFRRPRRFLELADQALERGKPIVVLKMARQPASAAMTVAHTGILAGAARSYRAAFLQHGVVEALGLDDLVDKVALFSRSALPEGDGLAVVSSSGGVTVIATDLCQELDIPLPELAEETVADLRALMPPYAPFPTNPLDITAGLSEKVLFDCLNRLASDPKIDLILNVATMLGGSARMRDRAEGLVRQRNGGGTPVISCWTGGSLADAGLEIAARENLPYYTSLERCLEGIRSFLDYRRRKARQGRFEAPPVEAAARELVRTALRQHLESGRRVIVERDAGPLFAAYGIPIVKSHPAENAEQAVVIATRLSGPVVLKADVDGLAHRARVGAVRLGLRGEVAVREAFEEIRQAVLAMDPTAQFRGVLVQPEALPGPEAVIGIAQDLQLGPMVVLGLGGVHVESFGPASVRLASLGRADAEELVGETALSGIGHRPALVETILRVGQFAADTADLVAECDLNPVRIYGDGVLALDALIVLRQSE